MFVPVFFLGGASTKKSTTCWRYHLSFFFFSGGGSSLRPSTAPSDPRLRHLRFPGLGDVRLARKSVPVAQGLEPKRGPLRPRLNVAIVERKVLYY